MKDRYDRAVDFLTKYPEQIEECWGRANSYVDEFGEDALGIEAHKIAGCLFENCGEGATGCLTQISVDYGLVAATPEMTKAIREDDRIPRHGSWIAVEDLPVFAEWRRRIDAEAKVAQSS